MPGANRTNGNHDIYRNVFQSSSHCHIYRFFFTILRNIQGEKMVKEIIRRLPDGETDYDGEETEDPSFDEMLEEWRFEMNTYNY